MTENDGRLDRLLAAPLAAVHDAGFSARVMARIAISRERRSLLEEAVLLASLGLILAFAASTQFSGLIGNLGYRVATSLPLATAALALALTLTLARPVAE